MSIERITNREKKYVLEVLDSQFKTSAGSRMTKKLEDLLFPFNFLAGVFNPLINIPSVVAFFSAISPLRYAVDWTRGIFYTGTGEFAQAVLISPVMNLAIMAAMFGVFLSSGTVLFVRAERNR